MTEEVRLDVKLRVSQTTADTIARLADERHTTRTGLVLQALGLLHASHDASKDGYYHGLTRDRSKLDTVLVAPL
jgi:hypothetical protein